MSNEYNPNEELPHFVNYVNLIINGPMQECVITYAQIAPLVGAPTNAAEPVLGKVRTRTVMTLSTLKQVHEAMTTTIAAYEKEFGKIPMAPVPETPPGVFN